MKSPENNLVQTLRHNVFHKGVDLLHTAEETWPELTKQPTPWVNFNLQNRKITIMGQRWTTDPKVEQFISWELLGLEITFPPSSIERVILGGRKGLNYNPHIWLTRQVDGSFGGELGYSPVRNHQSPLKGPIERIPLERLGQIREICTLKRLIKIMDCRPEEMNPIGLFEDHL